MRVVLGLFLDYDNGLAAIHQLILEGYPADEINAIVRSEVFQAEPEPIGFIPVDQKAGGETIARLKALLGDGQPMRVPEAGHVFVVNALATRLTETADPRTGLKAPLEDIGLEAFNAEAYQEGVRNGLLLVFVRTEEDRALQANRILADHGGRRTMVYATTLAREP